MCNPQLIAVGAQLGTGASTYQHQKAYVKAQNKANRLGFRRTKELARTDARLNFEAVRSLQAEAREDAAVDISNIIERAQQAAATTRTSAAASGVAGVSVSALINEVGQQQLDFITAAEQSVERIDRQAKREEQAIQSRFSARVQNALPTLLPEPSYLGHLIGTGGNALQAYNANGGNQGGNSGS